MQSNATDASARPWGRQNFLRPIELADRLGVDKATVYRAVKRGDVPAVQFGGKGHSILIPEAEFMAWLFSEGEGE